MSRSNPVTEQANRLRKKGTGGDTHLVHMNTHEMRVLEQVLGRGPTRNPHTGLPSFDDSGDSGPGESASSGGPGETSAPGGNPGGVSGAGGTPGTPDSAPSGTSQSKDSMDVGHSISGQPGGFGGPGEITGIDSIDSLLGKITNNLSHISIGNIIDTIAALSPIGMVNTAAKGLLGLSIGNVVDNLNSGIPATMGMANQNDLSVLGFDLGIPSNLAGAVKGATIAGAQDNTDTSTVGANAGSNQSGGAQGYSTGDALGQKQQDQAVKDAQAKQAAESTVDTTSLTQGLAPFTASQLSSTFNQNTGDIFKNLTFGNIGNPNSSSPFAQIKLPDISQLQTLGNSPQLPDPNKISVNVNDLAHPVLALLSSITGQNGSTG